MNCCLFTNNILNPFTPFGDGSLMRIANMYANVAQRGTREELTECFAMMTDRPADLRPASGRTAPPFVTARLLRNRASSG